jgi:hypothetical protein
MLVIVVVFGLRLTTLWSERADGQVFVEQMAAASQIDEAIGWLQLERDVTAQLMTMPPSERPRLLPRLDVVRVEADAAIAAAGLTDAALSAAAATSSDAAPEDDSPPAGFMLRLLPRSLLELRGQVDQQQLPPADMVLHYSTLIYDYHGELNQAVTVEGADARASQFVGYVASRASAEAFIQARAWGSVLLVADNVATHEWLLLAALAQTEDLFLAQARSAVAPGNRPPPRFLDEAPAQRPPQASPQALAAGGNDGGITPSVWFQSTEARVEAHRATIAANLEDLIDEADESVAEVESRMVAIAAFALALVTVGAAAAWWVGRSLDRSPAAESGGRSPRCLGRATLRGRCSGLE